jgi:hypothetical protein
MIINLKKIRMIIKVKFEYQFNFIHNYKLFWMCFLEFD